MLRVSNKFVMKPMPILSADYATAVFAAQRCRRFLRDFGSRVRLHPHQRACDRDRQLARRLAMAAQPLTLRVEDRRGIRARTQRCLDAVDMTEIGEHADR